MVFSIGTMVFSNNQVMFLGDNITQNLWVRMVIVKVLNGRKNQITKVLHVPRLKNNLFLMTQFDKVGRKIHIKEGICIFINKSKDIIIKCKLNSNLYKLGETIKEEKQIVRITTPKCVLVHSRFH
jgi:hypothetical protein